jgi:hypothetical protein
MLWLGALAFLLEIARRAFSIDVSELVEGIVLNI